MPQHDLDIADHSICHSLAGIFGQAGNREAAALMLDVREEISEPRARVRDAGGVQHRLLRHECVQHRLRRAGRSAASPAA